MATHANPPSPTGPEPHPVLVGGRSFVEGSYPCIGCDRSFYVLIPQEALYWWSRLCSQCDPTLELLPRDLEPGEVAVSLEQMPRWAA